MPNSAHDFRCAMCKMQLGGCVSLHAQLRMMIKQSSYPCLRQVKGRLMCGQILALPDAAHCCVCFTDPKHRGIDWHRATFIQACSSFIGRRRQARVAQLCTSGVSASSPRCAQVRYCKWLFSQPFLFT